MVSRAVSTWSLHRTLGRFSAENSTPSGGQFIPGPSSPNALPLLDLPSHLRDHGYDAVQIVHFHIPSRTPEYLAQLRQALADADITLDALLVDDGDLTDANEPDHQETWIGEWLEVAIALGARRARIMAGRATPTPERIAESGRRLARLAADYPGVRVVTENWMAMMPDADSVLGVLDAAGDGVGLLIDLGNWKGDDKYEQLAAIASRAETSHAKCHFTDGDPDADDYRRSLQILQEAGYVGPLALIYDSPNDDEWGQLDREWAIVREVFH